MKVNHKSLSKIVLLNLLKRLVYEYKCQLIFGTYFRIAIIVTVILKLTVFSDLFENYRDGLMQYSLQIVSKQNKFILKLPAFISYPLCKWNYFAIKLSLSLLISVHSPIQYFFYAIQKEFTHFEFFQFEKTFQSNKRISNSVS